MAVALPAHALDLAPWRAQARVDARHRLPAAHGARPHFGRIAERLVDRRRPRAIAREAHARKGGRATPRRSRRSARADDADHRLALDVRGEQDVATRPPGQPARRERLALGEVARRAAGDGHHEDVAAGRALVAHEAVDESDRLTVRRPAGVRDLQRRFPDRACLARARVDDHELGDPVVVGARAARRLRDQVLAVRRPVVVVDVRVRRADLAQRAARRIHDRDALLLDLLLDHAGVRLVCDQRALRLRRTRHVQDGQARAVGRPARVGELAADGGDRARRAAVRGRHVELELAVLDAVGEEGELPAVGRPAGVALAVDAAVPRHGDGALAAAVRARHANGRALGAVRGADALDPGQARAVGGERDVVGRAHLGQRVQDHIDPRTRDTRGAGRGAEEGQRDDDGGKGEPRHEAAQDHGRDDVTVRPRRAPRSIRVARTRPPTTSRRPTEMGRWKRRGPALPGLK